ncbi:MAG TPA: YezD family protein [Ktedonobacterales bacterium]|nr:YezD family protein [Ktedonobacterales bacterium]
MDSSAHKLDLTTDEEEVIAALIPILRRLQHGSVQVIVQDNRVIQIDTVEKLRLKPRTQRK